MMEAMNPDETASKPFVSDPNVRIGHVHLKVADLGRALGFYSGVLGLELTPRISDTAAFLSAGGYHHRFALNTWESLGGSPPPPATTGLYHTTILYPTRGPSRKSCTACCPRRFRSKARRRCRSRRKRIHLPPGP